MFVPEKMPHAREMSHRKISQDGAKNSHKPLHERSVLSMPFTQKKPPSAACQD